MTFSSRFRCISWGAVFAFFSIWIDDADFDEAGIRYFEKSLAELPME